MNKIQENAQFLANKNPRNLQKICNNFDEKIFIEYRSAVLQQDVGAVGAFG